MGPFSEAFRGTGAEIGVDIEIILGALVGTTALGYYLGRRSSGPKDHQTAIVALGLLDRDSRTNVLGTPALSTESTNPQAAEVAGAVLPTLPLFTDDEKKAILKEVSDWQKDQLTKGKLFSQGQWVSQDELDLKPSVFPSTVMAGPARPAALRYPTTNLQRDRIAVARISG
jgi:hypothetical protein